MNRIIFTLLLISTFNAYAGMEPFKDIPTKVNPTMLDKPFSPNYWRILGIQIDDNLSEHENLMNVNPYNTALQPKSALTRLVG